MKYQKQIVIAIFIVIFSLLYTTISNGATATVNTDTLKLRKEASLESSVLELLNQGQKLEVIEETGNWVKVKVKGMTGFVHKDYVQIEGKVANNTQNEVENTITNTVAENEISENTQQNTIVENTIETGANINQNENNVQETQTTNTNQVKQPVQVREETLKRDSNVFPLPVINANKIATLKKDSKVTILDEVKGWLYIETKELSGWIRTNSLEQDEQQTVQTSTTPEPPKQEEPENKEKPIDNKTMYVNSSSVYVRKGPSTQDEILDSLILNAQVVVTGEIEDWYKVKVNNKTGYIAKRLLSNNKTEPTNRGAEERQEENKQEEPKQEYKQEEKVTSSKGEQIANYAKQFLGCKYVYGASGPSSFDCSGFTMYVYKHFGINLSHSATAQSRNGSYVAKENLQLGDLVFFKDYETMDGIGHCGIYIGEGNFIHASSGTGYCVKISTLLTGAYKARYETARRLI